MKQHQNARKQRGRSAARKGGKSNSGAGNRSNEPKVRGNPKQLLEKYKTQAREAKQSGDRVQAEYFYQFADHYQRILNEINARNNSQNQREDEKADVDSSQDGQRQHRGRGRGRRTRGGETQDGTQVQSQEMTEGSNGSDAVAKDPATVEQPVEVHPELDLDGAKKEEKPKRRRAPARRRAASPKVEAEQAVEVKDKGASDPTPSPEGNEAA